LAGVRVLITGVSGHGHLLPLLPLARAFRERGHRVAVMVPMSYVSVFGGEDMEVLVAGADSPAVIAEVLRRTGEDVRGECTRSAVVEAFTTARNDLSVDDALPVVRDWRPDLVVHDVMDFLGPFVAIACDAHRVGHTFGSDVSADFIRACTQQSASDYRERGIRWRPADWVADICPSDLQVAGWTPPQGWLQLRPEAHRAPTGSVAGRPRPLTGHAKVLVTFGTVYTDPELLAPLIRDLTAKGYGVRVALGLTASSADFAVDRDTVAFEAFRPYAELLDDIDVVVGHGGAGTNLGALAAGIPLVLTPQGADQGGQAERVAAAGAAICVGPDAFSAEAVGRAVADVLEQCGYRTAARRIAGQIAAMPSTDEVAALLASQIGAG
jgi:UDP:flavonoid glycosyltransferase YjiC (YdhE family)